MASNERTSARVAKIAQRMMMHPELATNADIRSVAASVLTQCRDRKKPKPAKRVRKAKKSK